MERGAQGAIEYLLIIGAAILVVAIVILAVTGVLSGGQGNVAGGVTSVQSSFDAMKETSGNFISLDNKYYMKSSPILSGLAALWHFDDAQGATFVDSSGNGFNAVCDPGHCPLRANGLWGPAYEFGSTTHSALNDGNHIYVNAPAGSKLDFGKNDFTISLWFNTRDIPTEPTKADTIFSKGISDQAGVYGRFWCWIDLGYLTCRANSDSYNNVTPVTLYFGSFNKNEWYKLVFVREGASISLYKNGSLVDSKPLPVGFDSTINNPHPLRMGAEGRQGYIFNGYIDEVAIWSRALSAAEVNQLYTGALSAGK